MNLLIRADSSSQIGLGHIMRDLVLATHYPDDSIVFACQDLMGNVMDQIPYPVHILNTNSSEELSRLIHALKIDMVIFDHYGIDETYEKQIKEQTGVSIMCLDDTYQKHYCDILLNPNIYAQKDRYRSQVPPHTLIHCGKEHLLIRKEFTLTKQMPTIERSGIFVSMGGSDPKNLSMRVIRHLPETKKVYLVTTSANPHLEELTRYVFTHPNIQLTIDTPNMALLMRECSLAIITPSSIAHEVMFMELPFIAIQSADNQHEFILYMEREGLDVLRDFEPTQFQSLLEKRL